MDRISNSRLERNLFPYFFETQRPLVCLAFVVPLLFCYELGVLLLDDQAVRNGVDQMIQHQLRRVGFGELIVFPAIIIGTLLFWHHWRRDRWAIRPIVLLGMLAESIFLGLILLCCAKAQKILLDPQAASVLTMNFSVIYSIEWWTKLVSFIGAGIFEEFVFRLAAIAPFIFLGKRCLGSKKWYLVFIICVISSIIFALMHYDALNIAGSPFEWSSFLIRVLAGLFFCVIFLTRGFGVAVGVHAAYNVFTQF
ncbi:MAG TPA: CPBP family intramembrane metalloprotease [Pirellulaceae bacterium]|nr:CPBP family intramembrane metalloprotease [Pirellulaceae bacterium]